MAPDGSTVEFTAEAGEYAVAGQTQAGVTRGHATLNGRRATYFIDVPLFGRINNSSVIDPSWRRMTVTTEVLGLSIPVTYERVSWPESELLESETASGRRGQ